MRHGKAPHLMSALGHKRTSHLVDVMSALPPKADITERDRQDVRFVPKADIEPPYSIPAAVKICFVSGVARYVRNAFAASAEGALLMSAAP